MVVGVPAAVVVLRQEWDQYLRADGPKSVGSFLSSKALGATQKANKDGVALLTVLSSKGLEFDVVFVPGMSEGNSPTSTRRRRLLGSDVDEVSK